ncbi:PQQ-dependent sugar dehydrogenase [Alteribacillus sp. HJP-4]|uniref:PQQ-dependent sugar dehydrogenase n=1 Tax=Alteribacillus sp. HJP-4 TaxID=2775394 RepID=UPI0035CD0886
METSEEIVSRGEGGLLGFVLDPEFTHNQRAYLYHTYNGRDSLANRIIEVRRNEDTWSETAVLLEDIPGAQIHNGGRLKIGPDGKLFATAGDADDPDAAQNRESLAGSILRLNLDGSIPEDNPYEDSYIYSYGHRNPQGLAWNQKDDLYSSEHGSSAYDEINFIEPGNNYGWPENTGDDNKNEMTPPLIHSGEQTWAPSGSIFDEQNQYYVTGLRGTQLMRFNLEEEDMEVVLSGEGRLRDVMISGDEMYVITNNRDGRGSPSENDDQLLRLTNFEAQE